MAPPHLEAACNGGPEPQAATGDDGPATTAEPIVRMGQDSSAATGRTSQDNDPEQWASRRIFSCKLGAFSSGPNAALPFVLIHLCQLLSIDWAVSVTPC
jgi:hypothetical protein